MGGKSFQVAPTPADLFADDEIDAIRGSCRACGQELSQRQAWSRKALPSPAARAELVGVDYRRHQWHAWEGRLLKLRFIFLGGTDGFYWWGVKRAQIAGTCR